MVYLIYSKRGENTMALAELNFRPGKSGAFTEADQREIKIINDKRKLGMEIPEHLLIENFDKPYTQPIIESISTVETKTVDKEQIVNVEQPKYSFTAKGQFSREQSIEKKGLSSLMGKR